LNEEDIVDVCQFVSSLAVQMMCWLTWQAFGLNVGCGQNHSCESHALMLSQCGTAKNLKLNRKVKLESENGIMPAVSK